MSAMTADQVVAALRRRYGCEHDDIGPEWAALDEMDLQPGPSSRRIDLLAIRAWRGKRGHERHAIEVKVSRADLRRELDQPAKWQAWAAVTHRFYLAVPADLDLGGLVLPEQWGLITVNGAGTRQKRSAAHNYQAGDLPEAVAVEAFRRASRAEARIREAADGDLTAQVAALTKELAARERQVLTARQAEERWQRRADEALRLYADVAPDVFCRCGTRVVLRKGRATFGRGAHPQWEHDGEPGRDAYGECRFPRPDLDALAAEALPEPTTA